MINITLIRLLLSSLLIVGLVLIRHFENLLFYDPFLIYFKSDFLLSSFPEISHLILILSYLFRYSINSILSLGILWLIFKKSDLIKLAFTSYTVLFIILITAFYINYLYFPTNKISLFYIRRFLIHPIFLLLFLAGFLYQKHSDR